MHATVEKSMPLENRVPTVTTPQANAYGVDNDAAHGVDRRGARPAAQAAASGERGAVQRIGVQRLRLARKEEPRTVPRVVEGLHAEAGGARGEALFSFPSANVNGWSPTLVRSEIPSKTRERAAVGCEDGVSLETEMRDQL